MKKILKWFSLLFAVSVTVFVFFLLYSINSDEKIPKLEPLAYSSLLEKQEPDNALWLNHLSQTKKKGYFFPVDEVYIKTELVQKKKPKTVYKLLVKDLDPYQIFCLKEELKQHKLQYFFQKEKKRTKLLVYSHKRDKLENLTKVLRRYQIEAKIEQR